METLMELTKIVNRKRLSKIDVLDKTFLNKDNTNLYYKLYSGIESGAITSDDEAGKLLYGTDKSDTRYRMLKSRYKEKLKTTLLLLEPDEIFNNSIDTIHYKSINHFQTIELLIKLTGTSNLVIKLIREQYAICQKYKFYEILIKYSYYLISYYSLKGQIKKFYNEQAVYFQYSKKYQNELNAKQIYNEVILLFSSAPNINDEFLQKIRNCISNFEIILNQIDDDEPSIYYYYYYSRLMYEENMGNIEVINSLCDRISTLLNLNQFISNPIKLLTVLLYRLKTFLHSRNYNKGLIILYKDNSFFPLENSFNWFVLKEFEFKLYLHDNKVPEAFKVYESVLDNKYYKSQIKLLTEKWKIHHAYLVFMDNYLNKGDFKFSLAKFLNDVPLNTKDKGGYNFAIRLVELLFHCARKDYDIVFQKIEYLKSYKTRYLNDNTYKRNHLFLSLFLKAEKEGFYSKAMQNAEWTEIDELRKLNTYIIAEWEIVPFDVIWDIFVDLAKK